MISYKTYNVLSINLYQINWHRPLLWCGQSSGCLSVPSSALPEVPVLHTQTARAGTNKSARAASQRPIIRNPYSSIVQQWIKILSNTYISEATEMTVSINLFLNTSTTLFHICILFNHISLLLASNTYHI